MFGLVVEGLGFGGYKLKPSGLAIRAANMALVIRACSLLCYGLRVRA